LATEQNTPKAHYCRRLNLGTGISKVITSSSAIGGERKLNPLKDGVMQNLYFYTKSNGWNTEII
jgi:hypothetical protein